MPLEITGLSKRYGNRWVLRDAEFTASEGRVLGLLGGTASGKSTLLNLLAGAAKTNGGSAMLDGSDLLRLKQKDRGVTVIPGPAKPPLLGFLGSGPRQSSGESVLDGLDETLTKAGKIILLDDPFGHLDAATREGCFESVRRAARSRERIVIFVTTDFGQLAEVADDVAILAADRIVQTGTPQDVYEDPVTIAAARQTGDCNLFEARRLTSTDADLPEFH
ncbi:MAG TPA: ATP-binding cassette domain-containing protein, partial [Pyrinomonadaceae bacterium]|nr:ATP-binding cassette domain-containing protein [Pyrinomonadaceae bacterium]